MFYDHHHFRENWLIAHQQILKNLVSLHPLCEIRCVIVNKASDYLRGLRYPFFFLGPGGVVVNDS